ncbi:ATP-binding protein [Sphingoaurantiacus capsulatus]|uniref:histidine kinase n=1 Tax=Sphingoaurantiacus capsulatus TaxID=1771310 RepID=A0ABV7X5U7_9SPHN
MPTTAGLGAPASWLALALIWTIAAVVLGLIWTTIVAQVQFERSQAIEGAIRDNQNRVLAFERYVLRTLDAADVATRNLAEKYRNGLPTPRADGGPATISDPVIANPLFAAVLVADANADLVGATVDGLPPLNIGNWGSVRRIAQAPHDRVMIGIPRISPRLGKPMIGLTRRIDRPDGSYAGSVTLQLEVARFIAFTEGAADRPSDLISVVRLDGITIARRTGGRFSFGENLAGTLVMRQQLRDPNGTYLGPSSLDGVVRWFSHRRLPDYAIFVTSGIGHEEILAPVDARAGRYRGGGALLTVATLAIAGLLSVYARRRDAAARHMAAVNFRLREAQRIGRIGDWEYDPAKGVVLWSDQLCAMYGREAARDAMSIDDYAGHFRRGGRGAFLNAVEAAVQQGEARQLDLYAVGMAGEQMHRRLSIVPVVGAGGRVVQLIGTDQDVSADKANEQFRSQVAHGDRIAAINALAATLAHEMAQPLTAAINYLAASERLLSRDPATGAATAREAISHTRDQLRLAGDIMRRAKDLASGRTDHAAEVALPAVVDDVFALIRLSHPAVRLRRRLDASAQAVIADRVQVQQVLMNLVRNACEAAAEAKPPEVTVSSRTGDDAGFVVISVIDNGPGVSAPDDIFSPFASSKASGLGLGLTISRAIVQAHGGRIWVEPAHRPGTCICLTLPAVPPAE